MGHRVYLKAIVPNNAKILRNEAKNPIGFKVARSKLSPGEYSAERTRLMIVGVIEYIQQQQAFRIRNAREIAIAEHIIPDGPYLERLLRYEAAIEQSLARAHDRLDKLQAKRKSRSGDPSSENSPIQVSAGGCAKQKVPKPAAKAG